MTSRKRTKSKGQKPHPPCRNKLATLPSNAQISKRPLLRPPIASRYSGAEAPKVVYISSNTPFLSSVKRVEKLLRLADQRLVQSATAVANGKQRRGKRTNITKGIEAEDEIGNIAKTVEQLKDRKDAEEVTVKGTGRAIPKVMEIALWFQQRQEYTINLRTGTVSGIDDVEYEQKAAAAGEDDEESMQIDSTNDSRDYSRVVKRVETTTSDGIVAVSETRIRNLNVLELRVSLR